RPGCRGVASRESRPEQPAVCNASLRARGPDPVRRGGSVPPRGRAHRAVTLLLACARCGGPLRAIVLPLAAAGAVGSARPAVACPRSIAAVAAVAELIQRFERVLCDRVAAPACRPPRRAGSLTLYRPVAKPVNPIARRAERM